MHNKTNKSLMFILTLTAISLSGCVSNREKVAETPAAPAVPEQRLVVHDLATHVGNKSMVAAEVDFTNMTGRALDYVMFKTTAYDTEGKVISAHKSGRPNAWLRIAGPLQPQSRTGLQRWEKVWASSDIDCFRIEGAEVIFDDSSVEYYPADQIELDLTALPPALCQAVDESLAVNN